MPRIEHDTTVARLKNSAKSWHVLVRAHKWKKNSIAHTSSAVDAVAPLMDEAVIAIITTARDVERKC
jgi:hypothetical protein